MKTDFQSIVSDVIFRDGLLDHDKGPVLVALSGGADSVALLLVLKQLGFDCVAAHCNFHLRGEESDRDEAFVRSLCKGLDVPCVLTHFDVAAYQREHGVSMEMACRDLRYAWFEQVRNDHHCQAIAVAHHSDDNLETFFLNLFRGTGIAGLTGMKTRNGHVVRPLLEVSRSDIEAFLAELGQTYVTDSTNAENVVLRNRVRNVVLPAIDEMFPSGRRQVLLTMKHLSENQQLCAELVQNLSDNNIEKDAEKRFAMPYRLLTKFSQKSLILYEMAKSYGLNRAQCQQAIENYECRGKSGYFYSDSHYMMINRGKIVIKPILTTPSKTYKVDFNQLDELPVKLVMTEVVMQPFVSSLVNGKTRVAFDARIMECEKVVLRRWREGDSMVPFGMRGRKLLSDLFTDFKLDREQKKNVWILEADGEIVWVLGLRAASAYRVKNTSQSYIILTCNQGG